MADRIYSIMQSLDQPIFYGMVSMLTSGGYSKHSLDKHYSYGNYQNENNYIVNNNLLGGNEKDNLIEEDDRFESENSWFFMVFRLNMSRKKYELESNSISLLKMFYKNMLFTAL